MNSIKNIFLIGLTLGAIISGVQSMATLSKLSQSPRTLKSLGARESVKPKNCEQHYSPNEGAINEYEITETCED